MLEAVGEDYSTLETIKATGGVRPDEHWPATLASSPKASRRWPPTESASNWSPSMRASFRTTTSDPARLVVLDRLRTLADVFGGATASGSDSKRGRRPRRPFSTRWVNSIIENVGVNFDPANMILYGMGDPVDALRLLAGITWCRFTRRMRCQTVRRPGTWGAEVPLGNRRRSTGSGFISEVVVDRSTPSIDVVIERGSR